VVIEAKVVELQKNKLEQFGVDWKWEWQTPSTGENVTSGTGTFNSLDWILGLGFTTTAAFTRNLDLTLKLLCENESATIVANPHVVATDGEEAEIKVITEEYFQIVSVDIVVRSELEVITSGIVLKMRPRIAENGDITMQVSPEVSNVVGQGSRELPVITRRTATTTVRVKDGGTIIIGGLLDNRSRTDVRKVPLLGSIPILGALFRNDNLRSDSRQIAILITPRIVEKRDERETFYSAFDVERPVNEPAGQDFQQALEGILSRPTGARQS
jgi:type IV pilus assembly protein PilQ